MVVTHVLLKLQCQSVVMGEWSMALVVLRQLIIIIVHSTTVPVKAIRSRMDLNPTYILVVVGS